MNYLTKFIQSQIISILYCSLLVFAGTTQLFAQTSKAGTFTDRRDGQTYKTITFEYEGKEYTWFAQNLNYKREGSFVPENMSDYRKKVSNYPEFLLNRSEFGSYYTWEAAKMACPNGWHLPSDGEWSILVNKFGGTGSVQEAGKALKSDKGWNNTWDKNSNGTNSSGFNAHPAGYRDSDGNYGSNGGMWWTASPAAGEEAWIYMLSFMSQIAKRSGTEVSIGVSVRCVRD